MFFLLVHIICICEDRRTGKLLYPILFDKFVYVVHTLNVARAKHTLNVGGAKHTLNVAGTKHTLNVGGAKHTLSVGGAAVSLDDVTVV